MSFISYAQNYEDVMLWRALKHVKSGFYIDVGAWSPNVDSVTRLFYANGWSGINIEPNPEFYTQYINQRSRDINLKLAVGDKEGHILINFMSNPGLSTAIDKFAKQHEFSGLNSTKKKVELTTLATICGKYVQPDQAIHFLKVDVEGLEEAVLHGNDWSDYRPWVVVVEATLPMTQTESYAAWESILLNERYVFVYADGLNRFYVANEHAELSHAFKYPPNVFDDFLLNSQQESEVRVQELEVRVQESEVRAQESEVRAQEFEVRAQESEAMAHKHAMQLLAVYSSTSWRVTASLRWPMRQWRLLHQYGAKGSIKVIVKKVLRKLVPFVVARPVLKYWVTRLAYRLGVAGYLKSLAPSTLRPATETFPSVRLHLGSECNNYAGIYLDKRAVRVLADLKNEKNEGIH